jgi:hypothetical protein
MRVFAGDLVYPDWFPTEFSWQVSSWFNLAPPGTWKTSGRGLLPQGWAQGQQEIDYVVTIPPLTGTTSLVVTVRVYVSSGQVKSYPKIELAGVPQTIEGPLPVISADFLTDGSGEYLIGSQVSLAPGATVGWGLGGFVITPVPWNAIPAPPNPVFPWIPTP